jgi:HEAT repeat protein
VCKSHPKEVLAALRPQQSAVSHRAVIEGLSGTGKKGAKALAQGMLAANHPLRRRIAAQILGKMGKEAADEVDALIQMLNDMVDDVRIHAARALGATENGNEQVIAGLSASRGDSVLAVRNEAMWALDRLSGKAETMVVIEATPFPITAFDETVLDAAVLAKEKKLDPFRLKLLLSDGRPTVRINAATALGTLGAKGKEAVRQLALSLKDGNLEFRCAAARALGSIKEEPHIAVPALATALFQASDKQTETVLAALKAFGPVAVKPLLEGLSQRPERVEGTLLKAVKAEPKTYLKGLVQALVEGKNTIIQENAADVITALGVDAASAEKSVVQALEFDSVLVRAKVIRALGRIAKPGKALNATLRKIAESDNRIAVLDAVDDAMLYLRARSRK